MKNCTAQSVVDAFLHGYKSYFGVPKVIVIHSEAQFDSFCLYRFTSIFGLSAHRNSGYNPQSNSLVKNTHRRLKAALRMQVSPNRSFHSRPLVLLSIYKIPSRMKSIVRLLIWFLPSNQPCLANLTHLVFSDFYQGDFVRYLHEHFHHIN